MCQNSDVEDGAGRIGRESKARVNSHGGLAVIQDEAQPPFHRPGRLCFLRLVCSGLAGRVRFRGRHSVADVCGGGGFVSLSAASSRATLCATS